MEIKVSIKQHPYEWLSVLLLMVYFSPLIFMPNQALFLIHDNLNSNVVWYKNIAESGKMFAKGHEIVDFTLGGIPRDCLPSEWSVDRLLYLFFDAQTAYSINYILLHLIAFFGMRLFLRRYVTQVSPIFNLVSLIFAMLPFWPSGGLTVSGLPLLVYALLNVFNNNSNKWDWLIIALFPFYSSLPFGNLFSFPLLFVFYLVGMLLRKWTFKWIHLFPFTLLLTFTLVSNNRLIGLLLNGFESNRLADIASISNFMNFKGVIGSSILAFLFGHYHFHSFNSLIAITSIIIIIIYVVKNRTLNLYLSKALYLMLLIGFLSFITLFLANYDLKSFLGEWFPKISLRFWVVYPFIWYVVFALVLVVLYKANRLVAMGLIFLQLSIVFLLLYPRDYFGARYAENIFANTFIHSTNEEQQKWNDYYRVEEIEKIKEQVPHITESFVATIGISPEILQYNGLKTIEGYYAFFPIEKVFLIKQIDSLERVKVPPKKSLYSNRNYLYYHENSQHELPKWDYELLTKHGVSFLVSNKLFVNSNMVFENKATGLFVYKID